MSDNPFEEPEPSNQRLLNTSAGGRTSYGGSYSSPPTSGVCIIKAIVEFFVNDSCCSIRHKKCLVINM